MKVEIIKVGNLKTNCYLIIKNNKCLIVDPGDEFDKITNRITKLNLIPLKVLITHHHFDHIGDLKEITEYYNIDYINFKNYKSDYETFKIGNFKFKIINTPGHKEDSVSYYFYENNVIFTGDFLFKGTIGRCDLKGSSITDMKESIEKIKKYNNNIIIYPGHGIFTSLGYEKENNEYFN